FLFSSRRRHTRFSRDWSSDVCSSDLPRWFWIFLGIAELAAAVGITLPGLTRILPWLVVWAAAGIAFVMVAATIWHVVRGEFSSALITLVLLGMAGYVLWMRHRVLPIRERRA